MAVLRNKYMMRFFLTPENKKRGFTLLIAALVASVVLSLGSSIALIGRKQVELSSLGRSSQFAFYAADSGAECALYWDVKRPDTFAIERVPFGYTSFVCDGHGVVANIISNNGAEQVFQFRTDFTASPDSQQCVEATVTKNVVTQRTLIHSDGYSTNCTELEAGAPALQRSIELSY